MTEKEKRAIDILGTFEFRRKTINYNKISIEDVKSVKTILNLIEKQQEELEGLLNANNE